MAASVVVNSLGLLLDIFGAAGLFCFGLPSWIPHNKDDLVIDGGNLSEAQDKKPDRNTKWARASLGLLVLGFALQLLSNLLRP